MDRRIREPDGFPEGRSPFQRAAVPLAKIGGRFVGALAEVEERIAGRFGAAHIVVHQQEFAELLVVECRGGTRLPLAETGRQARDYRFPASSRIWEGQRRAERPRRSRDSAENFD